MQKRKKGEHYCKLIFGLPPNDSTLHFLFRESHMMQVRSSRTWGCLVRWRTDVLWRLLLLHANMQWPIEESE